MILQRESRQLLDYLGTITPPWRLNPYHPISSVTVLTELPRLLHTKVCNSISAVYFDKIPCERRVFYLTR